MKQATVWLDFAVVEAQPGTMVFSQPAMRLRKGRLRTRWCQDFDGTRDRVELGGWKVSWREDGAFTILSVSFGGGSARAVELPAWVRRASIALEAS